MTLAFCKTFDCQSRCPNAVYVEFDHIKSPICKNCNQTYTAYFDRPEERQNMVDQLQGKYGKCQIKDCDDNLNHKHICNNHPQGVCKEEGCNESVFNWRCICNDRQIERMEKKKIKNANHIAFTEFKDNLYCWEHSSQGLKDYMDNLGEDKNDDFLEFI